MKDIETILNEASIKPTSNRILVLRELIKSPCPLSLGELEATIRTMEKSSILRTLNILLEHNLIHAIEDGRGVIKYEQCSGHFDGQDLDMHVHFYCESCRKLTCFEDIAVPAIDIPGGYVPRTVNYLVKGTCPDCLKTRTD